MPVISKIEPISNETTPSSTGPDKSHISHSQQAQKAQRAGSCLASTIPTSKKRFHERYTLRMDVFAYSRHFFQIQVWQYKQHVIWARFIRVTRVGPVYLKTQRAPRCQSVIVQNHVPSGAGRQHSELIHDM